MVNTRGTASLLGAFVLVACSASQQQGSPPVSTSARPAPPPQRVVSAESYAEVIAPNSAVAANGVIVRALLRRLAQIDPTVRRLCKDRGWDFLSDPDYIVHQPLGRVHFVDRLHGDGPRGMYTVDGSPDYRWNFVTDDVRSLIAGVPPEAKPDPPCPSSVVPYFTCTCHVYDGSKLVHSYPVCSGQKCGGKTCGGLE
jgi:hypothetical protein